MELKWKCLDEDYCYVAPAPLFGNIRVERYSATKGWQIYWSVPGMCGLLLKGDFLDAKAAIEVAETYVRDSYQPNRDEPAGDGWRTIDDGAPTDGTPVQVYASTYGWDGKGIVCAAYHCNQWRVYGIINGMPSAKRHDTTQWLTEVKPTHWRPLPEEPSA